MVVVMEVKLMVLVVMVVVCFELGKATINEKLIVG